MCAIRKQIAQHSSLSLRKWLCALGLLVCAIDVHAVVFYLDSFLDATRPHYRSPQEACIVAELIRRTQGYQEGDNRQYRYASAFCRRLQHCIICTADRADSYVRGSSQDGQVVSSDASSHHLRPVFDRQTARIVDCRSGARVPRARNFARRRDPHAAR